MRTLPLRRFARIVNGGTPSPDEENWNGDVEWATPVDLARSDGGYLNSTDRKLTAVGLAAGSTAVPAGSILLSTRAPIGYTALVTQATAFNQGCKALLPSERIDARFLQFVLISQTEQLKSAGSGSTFLELSNQALSQASVPDVPLEEQRRIADFLDDRVARIDQIIAARQRQIGCLRQVQAKWSFDAIRGGGLSERKDSGAPWLGTIPKDWPMLSVTSQFQVDLGKMLDEKSQTGTYAVPYLRNTNVQWDVIDTSDLKSMDISPEEMSRFTVQRGDLLICEGGQPGRAAMWDGLESPLGYQKALHRARSRGRSLPEWLLECLRAGVDQEAIVSSSGQTTIAHLPNDQLRATKFPFPDPAVQREQLARLKSLRIKSSEAISAIERQCLAMKEYKQSLITAAVTGKFDVATASTKIPE